MAWSCEEKAKVYNSRQGDLTGYDCPICKNKGKVMVFIDGYEYLNDCECMEKRRNLWRIEKSGLSDMVKRYTFDSFEVKAKYQKAMKDMAEAFCDDAKGWFYIGGQVGCGKTHICTAIANNMMQKGLNVRYMIWPDEVTKLKAIKMDEQQYSLEIGYLKDAPVLYIDDFFKTANGDVAGKPTTADINIAFELINGRYNDSGKITIFSGERPIGDIIDLDEALGSRIKHRCGVYNLTVGKGKEKNYRLKDGAK